MSAPSYFLDRFLRSTNGFSPLLLPLTANAADRGGRGVPERGRGGNRDLHTSWCFIIHSPIPRIVDEYSRTRTLIRSRAHQDTITCFPYSIPFFVHPSPPPLQPTCSSLADEFFPIFLYVVVNANIQYVTSVSLCIYPFICIVIPSFPSYSIYTLFRLNVNHTKANSSTLFPFNLAVARMKSPNASCGDYANPPLCKVLASRFISMHTLVSTRVNQCQLDAHVVHDHSHKLPARVHSVPWNAGMSHFLLF